MSYKIIIILKSFRVTVAKGGNFICKGDSLRALSQLRSWCSEDRCPNNLNRECFTFSNTLSSELRALSNPETGRKLYWALINIILNKAQIPIIPPLLENDVFVLGFAEKAEIFYDYFIQQCTTIEIGSKLPPLFVLNIPLLTAFSISDDKILHIIRSLNPNKAHGCDGISVRMIKICDFALLLPPRLIVELCVGQDVFPEVWNQANIVPIHKKGSKNLKQNYRPIPLPPIFDEILEKLIFDCLYHQFDTNNLFNPNHSGFRPGDSTVYQLLTIVNSIFTS